MTLIARAVTNRHRSIKRFTVGYMDKKSVYTTGIATFLMCALVRPPKNADCAYPRYFLEKFGCRSRIGTTPILRKYAFPIDADEYACVAGNSSACLSYSAKSFCASSDV